MIRKVNLKDEISAYNGHRLFQTTRCFEQDTPNQLAYSLYTTPINADRYSYAGQKSPDKRVRIKLEPL